MSSKCVILDPGHGLNKEGKFGRPLIDCTKDKAIIVPNSMYPQDNDYEPNFYREDLGTLAIAKKTAINQGFQTKSDRPSP